MNNLIEVTSLDITEFAPIPSIKSIQIDEEIGEGQYAKVYSCNIINNKKVFPLAIKLFNNSKSSKIESERCYTTILKFQEKITIHNSKLKKNGEKTIDKINALFARPLFCFKGNFKGKEILGYATNLLGSDYIEFDKLFNNENENEKRNLKKKYYNQTTILEKYNFAYDLVTGFIHLRAIGFIHSDLNPKNFFINFKKKSLVIIDFDGGAITDGKDNPTTFGKPGSWLAPEISKQLLNNTGNLINVNIDSDYWSIMLAIHHLLFPAHPLFYLSQLSEKNVKKYFEDNKWPNIDENNSSFRLEYKNNYKSYIEYFDNEIDKNIIKGFSETINRGYFNPSHRYSYNKWKYILEKLCKVSTDNQREIDWKKCDKGSVKSLNSFIKKYKKGKDVNKAKQFIVDFHKRLNTTKIPLKPSISQREEDWKTCDKKNRNSLLNFRKKYNYKGEYIQEAEDYLKKLLREEDWRACDKNSIESLENFRKK